MSTLGNCQTDNQIQYPVLEGLCLAGMHLDASTIDTPEASSLAVGDGQQRYVGLGVLQCKSTSAVNPASQNDFYGNAFTRFLLRTARGCNGLRCGYPYYENHSMERMVEVEAPAIAMVRFNNTQQATTLPVCCFDCWRISTYQAVKNGTDYSRV